MDIENLTKRLKESKTREERMEIRLDTILLITNLAGQYASNLQNFSESIIRNKEEWFKKSMIECIHQAGREVGYQHEANRIDVEAAKALLEAICDMEMVHQGLLADQLSGQIPTDPSSTSELASLTEEEQKSSFGKTDDTAI